MVWVMAGSGRDTAALAAAPSGRRRHPWLCSLHRPNPIGRCVCTDFGAREACLTQEVVVVLVMLGKKKLPLYLLELHLVCARHCPV